MNEQNDSIIHQRMRVLIRYLLSYILDGKEKCITAVKPDSFPDKVAIKYGAVAHYICTVFASISNH